MSKKSILNKTLMLIALISVFSFYRCDYYGDEKEFRCKITVETNLSSLNVYGIQLDSNSVYPFILYEEHGPLPSSYYYRFTIYPSPDIGIIRLYIYGGDGYSTQYYFKDSMTIYAPIDTTYIEIDEYHFLRN